jgi:hypothetical protein
MDLLRRIHRIQDIRLCGAGSPAANIDSRNGSLFAQNDGASRGAPWIGEVADLDAFYIGESAATIRWHGKESFAAPRIIPSDIQHDVH